MVTTDGYFAPDGAARRVSRELALMLGGGRALLLQVAHPLVAAGVAEHSGYRENPVERLEGTMNAVWAIVFGTRAQADRAARRVRVMHERVHGSLPEAMGRYPAGTRTRRWDPELLLWVHATLVDTALLVHGRMGATAERCRAVRLLRGDEDMCAPVRHARRHHPRDPRRLPQVHDWNDRRRGPLRHPDRA